MVGCIQNLYPNRLSRGERIRCEPSLRDPGLCALEQQGGRNLPRRTIKKLYAKDMQPITYQKRGAEDVTLHHRNLQDAIRKNQPLNCDCMLGMYGVAVCEMAVESFRKRRYVKSDQSNARRVSS